MNTAMLSLVLLACAGAVAAEGEVKLQLADSRLNSFRGSEWQDITIDVLVKNIAFDKKVSIHYEDRDGQWKDWSASFNRKINSELEIWTVRQTVSLASASARSAPERKPLDLKFAVKYEADGQTFWDNNGRQEYNVGAGSGELITQPILSYVGKATIYNQDGSIPPIFSIGAFVQNIAYAKEVKVHYTLDNWQSTITGDLSPRGLQKSYSYMSYPNVHGTEYWELVIENQDLTTKAVEPGVRYYLTYKANGVTYLDNNHGANYMATVTVFP